VVVETHSAEETMEAGRRIAAALPARGVLLLTGDLGAGKTTVSKGIVAGRGVAAVEEVSSPTFPIIHEYGDPVAVYHIDLYRLETAAEVEGIGLDEILDRDALVLIEWGEKFRQLLPPDCYELRLEHRGGDDRRLTLRHGPAVPESESR
jgi:tRNA threonylcarbamoyladenosine biosynthesis protein TsaE